MRGWVVIVCVAAYGCAGSPQSNLSKGDELLRSGDFARARNRYARAIRTNRLCGPAYLGFGRAAIGLGDLGSADDALRRAIELLPPGSKEGRDAAIALAEVHLRMSPDEARLQDVEKTGTELCRRDSNSYDGRRLLGALALQRAELRHRSGNRQLSEVFLKDAESEFATADRVSPRRPEVMSGLARSLAVNGKLAEAAVQFRALVALEPHNPNWYAELYRVLLASGKLREADELLASAIAANPQFPEFAVMRAAQVLENRAALAGALDRLAASGDKWYPAFLAAGDFWVRARDLTRARSVYERCAAQSKPAREACRARVLSLLDFEGKTGPARELARQMLAENRDDVAARLVEARARIDDRDLVNALNELQSIVIYDPRNYDARYQLARVHMLSGEVEQARQQLSEAIELHPDFLEARLKLAQIQIIRGEFRAAMQLAGGILSQHPDSSDAHRIYDYAEQRVRNPGLRGLWGSASDNVQRLGEVRLVMEGDPSDAAPSSSASRESSQPPTSGTRPADAIYLRNTLVDDAIRGYRILASRTYDAFDFTRAVPGVWPAAPK